MHRCECWTWQWALCPLIPKFSYKGRSKRNFLSREKPKTLYFRHRRTIYPLKTEKVEYWNEYNSRFGKPRKRVFVQRRHTNGQPQRRWAICAVPPIVSVQDWPVSFSGRFTDHGQSQKEQWVCDLSSSSLRKPRIYRLNGATIITMRPVINGEQLVLSLISQRLGERAETEATEPAIQLTRCTKYHINTSTYTPPGLPLSLDSRRGCCQLWRRV